MDGARPVRAPRGTTLTARSWQTEAPLRMLHEQPRPRGGRAPRRPRRLRRHRQGGPRLAPLRRDRPHADRRSRDDETMLVQSGRPVGVLRTHEWAPRVLIANSNLVGDWATWPEFRRLEQLGLTMYGQMTAGSWIYIGTQGILQGTYETFAAVAAKRFGGTLAGTLTLTGGCGGMGGAQPLAVTLNGGVCLVVDVDAGAAAAPGRAPLPRRGRRRPRRRRRAGAWPPSGTRRALSRRRGRQRGRRCCPSCCAAASRSTSSPTRPARTTRCRYLPEGVDLGDWHDYAASQAGGVHRPGPRVDGPARRGDGRLPGRRRRGLRLRQLDPRRGAPGGYERAFAFPGFVPAYIRPLFCEGKGPFRWAALSGDPADIAATDRAVLDLFPDNEPPARWIRAGRRAGRLPGPAGADLLARLRRARPGRAAVQRDGRRPASCSAPIVIGRDHLDCGSVASPYRETEAMADGSDAIADWPLLNALVNTASGASWVSIHHGGGVGIGRSIHAGQVSVADGTDAGRAQKLERVLTNDPGMGVIRHVDAGYDRAERGRRGARRPRPDARRADGRRGLGGLRRGCGRTSRRSAATPATGGYRRFAWTRGRR